MRTLIHGILFLVCGPTAVVAAPLIDVAFHPNVSVSTSVVHLGDLAEIRTAEEANLQRWQSAVIAPAPTAGAKRHFTFAEIHCRLSALGLPVQSARFGGSSLIEVQRTKVSGESSAVQTAGHQTHSKTTVQRRRVIHRLEKSLRKLLATAFDPGAIAAVRVEARADTLDQLSPLTQTNTTFDWLGWSQPFTQQQDLVVAFRDREGQSRSVPVTCFFQFHPQLPTVKFRLSRGHRIQAEDLDWTYAEAMPGVIRSPQDLIGREVVKTLSPGNTIHENDVVKTNLVRRRDQVLVVSRVGQITVSRMYSALGAGGEGDVIAVVDNETRDRFQVVVTGLRRAEVLESYTARQQQPINPKTASFLGTALPQSSAGIDGTQPRNVAVGARIIKQQDSQR